MRRLFIQLNDAWRRAVIGRTREESRALARREALARTEREHARHGRIALRWQRCQECDAGVLTKMTEPAPTSCSQHTGGRK